MNENLEFLDGECFELVAELLMGNGGEDVAEPEEGGARIGGVEGEEGLQVGPAL